MIKHHILSCKSLPVPFKMTGTANLGKLMDIRHCLNEKMWMFPLFLFLLLLGDSWWKLWPHPSPAAEKVCELRAPLRPPNPVHWGCTSAAGLLPGATETESGGRQYTHHHPPARVPYPTHWGATVRVMCTGCQSRNILNGLKCFHHFRCTS